jgi:hypothetical protein
MVFKSLPVTEIRFMVQNAEYDESLPWMPVSKKSGETRLWIVCWFWTARGSSSLVSFNKTKLTTNMCCSGHAG